MNKKEIRQLIRYARLKGIDELEIIQEYFEEHDSRFSRAEVRRIVAGIMTDVPTKKEKP